MFGINLETDFFFSKGGRVVPIIIFQTVHKEGKEKYLLIYKLYNKYITQYNTIHTYLLQNLYCKHLHLK